MPKGKPLTDIDKEAIRQIYALTDNKAETARRLKYSERVIHKVLAEVADPALSEERADATSRMTGRMQDLVHRIIDAVTESDLKRASLPQKSISIGIGIDKILRLDEYERIQRGKTDSGQLLPPQQITAMLGAVRGQIKSLAIMGVKLEDAAPDLTKDIEAVLQAAEVVEAAKPAEAEVVLDFDNPGLVDDRDSGNQGLPNDDSSVVETR